MSYVAQRDVIAQIVRTVTDVGQVHDHPRFGDAAEHWIVELDGIQQIRAWEIGLDDPGVEVDETFQGSRQIWRNWRIAGYVAVVDGDTDSYTTIITLADTIADALDANHTLNSTCLSHEAVQRSDPITVRLPYDGANALCWGITLSMRTLETDA